MARDNRKPNEVENEPIPKADQSVLGGAFLVNGVLVNCEGEPIETTSTEPAPVPPTE